MASKFPVEVRDQIITAFRERVCEQLEITPLVHQREWWCAADGTVLQPIEDPGGIPVMLDDKRIVRWQTIPRSYGRAKVIADLGAFKSGKSFGSALWATGFAAVPGARVTLVGLEYNMAEPEFNYICEFLLSDSGMGLKAASLINRPRQGDMFLELANGARFEAKSWERKDSLKGKEIDCYLYCEAYQLPGIECYTAVRQNLVAREGYAVFPTTPDKPWLKEIHDRSHGQDPEYKDWECICSVARKQNPFTYSEKEEAQDRTLLTKEKYAIAHYGQLGDFVGRVFRYQRGAHEFSAATHPELFREGGTNRADLLIPGGWEIVGGADTGTYYTALAVAFSPNGDAFVLDEFPNYSYVGGAAERDELVTIPRWAATVRAGFRSVGGRTNLWADPNSQFKSELRNYSIALLPARLPVETRTEITREYFEHHRIYLAPWLRVLPFELENASWPEEASATGKFARVKDRDHTLDCLEHILGRRPIGKRLASDQPKGSWAASMGMRTKRPGKNVHLGGS